MTAITHLLFLFAVAFAQTFPHGPALPGKPIQPPPPPPVLPVTPASPSSVPPSANRMEVSRPADLLSGVIEDYTYVPTGKRDPFLPYEAANQGYGAALGPVFPLQKFDLDQLKIVGIIWDVRHPKAMIVDPTGKGYVVKVNEKIGRNNGYVARIREGEIVVVESFTNNDGKVSYQTKLIKLSSD